MFRNIKDTNMFTNKRESTWKVNERFEELINLEVIELLGFIYNNTDLSLVVEHLNAVIKFSTIFENPVELIGFTHCLGESYLAEKERADKLQATLNAERADKIKKNVEMHCESKIDSEVIKSKERETAELKSSLALVISALNMLIQDTGLDMPELKLDDPQAARQMLGSFADHLDVMKGRIEDTMRELAHRHNLAEQPYKVHMDITKSD
ncbi:hypothetical protein HVX40_24505 (plasmid) [Escherichia coli]|nr:hypothetical protein [Escherichia coli]MBA8354165.1 hypothetical protein [Escherichia coli]